MRYNNPSNAKRELSPYFEGFAEFDCRCEAVCSLWAYRSRQEKQGDYVVPCETWAAFLGGVTMLLIKPERDRHVVSGFTAEGKPTPVAYRVTHSSSNLSAADDAA